ncbi:Flagellar basal-body rod protein FlgG [Fundidesulfovibrio magnetotacticus]|uniref:Flagellar basal-body rod protein FlgG n=1 Tax=Fundidesulfovibrio magnetotacticus TaxID=2730080 RepID=A0A6V8LWQ4_9BACT|nr:flagellar basal-body rod protein FlgF [Fundidesulfovibrio magnetotacticus]GFK92705.1 Flagellar basal-body rod protein FlgG [Fundidesulfovibrio magnetotacticus]
MQQSSISALFGALSNETRMAMVANNLANVTTAGYKADRVSFQDVFQRMATDYSPDARNDLQQKQLLPKPLVVAKPRLAEQTVDATQGGLNATGNPLDLAISGPGFFRVQTPEGQFLTRNGQFYRNNQGMLVTNQGYPVMGQAGPVAIPEGQTVTVTGDGQMTVDGQIVGSIDVVDVPDVKQLKKYGQSLFTGPNNSQPVTQPVDRSKTSVYQGYLEQANVNVVSEMVAMIEVQRSFEAYTKIISSTQEMDQQASTKVGETR